MPTGNPPSVRLRRIGSALRKAREERGMTMETACRRYGRSKGWLSMVENGLLWVDPQELADLLDFYEVGDGPLRESLLHLAAHKPGKNWQRVREGRISAAALDLASLEQDAELIRTFQPCLIPGLLQTPDYTRALIAVGPHSTQWHREALVQFRMARQRVLSRPDPPRYMAIIAEAALRHQVGDDAVMKAQLRRLVSAARLETVELRILPESAGAYLWLAGPFDFFVLRPPGRLAVTVVEQFTKSLFVEEETEVAEHEETFSKLLAGSLPEGPSLELIERIASTA